MSAPPLILLDLDDTLICSSYISNVILQSPSGVGNHSDSDRRFISSLIHDVESHAMQLLESAMMLGHVVVVTNAQHTWVTYICSKFFPSLFVFFETKAIPLVSARERFESYFPDDPLMWKISTFLFIINECTLLFGGTSPPCIVSVGDGHYERWAAHIVAHRHYGGGSPALSGTSARAVSTVSSEHDSGGATSTSTAEGSQEQAPNQARQSYDCATIPPHLLTAAKIPLRSVKMLDNPTPALLCSQISMLTSRLESIVRSACGVPLSGSGSASEAETAPASASATPATPLDSTTEGCLFEFSVNKPEIDATSTADSTLGAGPTGVLQQEVTSSTREPTDAAHGVYALEASGAAATAATAAGVIDAEAGADVDVNVDVWSTENDRNCRRRRGRMTSVHLQLAGDEDEDGASAHCRPKCCRQEQVQVDQRHVGEVELVLQELITDDLMDEGVENTSLTTSSAVDSSARASTNSASVTTKQHHHQHQHQHQHQQQDPLASTTSTVVSEFNSDCTSHSSSNSFGASESDTNEEEDEYPVFQLAESRIDPTNSRSTDDGVSQDTETACYSHMSEEGDAESTVGLNHHSQIDPKGTISTNSNSSSSSSSTTHFSPSPTSTGSVSGKAFHRSNTWRICDGECSNGEAGGHESTLTVECASETLLDAVPSACDVGAVISRIGRSESEEQIVNHTDLMLYCCTDTNRIRIKVHYGTITASSNVPTSPVPRSAMPCSSSTTSGLFETDASSVGIESIPTGYQKDQQQQQDAAMIALGVV